MALLIFFLDLLWVFPRNVRNIYSLKNIRKFPRIVNFLPSLEFHSNLCSLKGFCVPTSSLTTTRQTTDCQCSWSNSIFHLTNISAPLAFHYVYPKWLRCPPDPCIYLTVWNSRRCFRRSLWITYIYSNPLCWVLTGFSFTRH